MITPKNISSLQFFPLKAAIVAMSVLSAGTLSAKDIFLSGLSEAGTDWALFDVSKNVLKTEWESLFEDDNMCSFATSANMLAYQQWRNSSGFPSSMPQGNQEIYNDMQKIYGNIQSSMDAILGAYSNNNAASYPQKYYNGELRDYSFCVWVKSYNGSPYPSITDSEKTIPGLYIDMPIENILKWAFEHNSAMGLNLQPYYEMGTDPHAITLWGARYSDFDNTITGLFYTNSDDTEGNNQEKVGIRMTKAFGYDESGSLYCELDGKLRYKIHSVTLLNPEAFVIPEPSAFGLITGTLAVFIAVSGRRRRV